jgi:hypothetical protein
MVSLVAVDSFTLAPLFPSLKSKQTKSSLYSCCCNLCFFEFEKKVITWSLMNSCCAHTHTHTPTTCWWWWWWHNWTQSLFLFFLHETDGWNDASRRPLLYVMLTDSLSLSLSLSVSLWPWFWVQSVLHPRSTIGWIGLTLTLTHTHTHQLHLGSAQLLPPHICNWVSTRLLSYSSTQICNWVTRTVAWLPNK